MIDLETLPDRVATAFDETDQEMMIPRFRSPQLKKSFTDFGYFALPVSARLPKSYGNAMASGFNSLTAAMKALSRGKLRAALTRSREADRQFSVIETQIKSTLDGYRNIVRRTQNNPDLMNLDLREMAQATGDDALLRELTGMAGVQIPQIAQGRLNELDKFGAELQLKRERLKLDTIKTILDAHKMLKPVQFEDITVLDRINQERALSGMAPMAMEEYLHFKANTKESEPETAKEYEKAKTDPEYLAFIEKMKGKEGTNKTKEYEYAKTQGYQRSFVDFIKETRPNGFFGDEDDEPVKPTTDVEAFSNYAGLQPTQTQQQPAGQPIDMRARILSEIQKSDPKTVYKNLSEAYQQTGKEELNPSKYLDIFPSTSFLGKESKMEKQKEPVWNPEKGGWDLPK